jgi:hypothetical protein
MGRLAELGAGRTRSFASRNAQPNQIMQFILSATHRHPFPHNTHCQLFFLLLAGHVSRARRFQMKDASNILPHTTTVPKNFKSTNLKNKTYKVPPIFLLHLLPQFFQDYIFQNLSQVRALPGFALRKNLLISFIFYVRTGRRRLVNKLRQEGSHTYTRAALFSPAPIRPSVIHIPLTGEGFLRERLVNMRMRRLSNSAQGPAHKKATQN